MQTIRILLYTDVSVFTKPGDPYSISEAQRFIELKLKNIAHVEFTIKNRHFDYVNNVEAPAATKLTDELLSEHDELWVFSFRNDDTKANPEFGLDVEEVENLFKWMQRGGVMVTGDHSQPPGTQDCLGANEHDSYFAIGSPLGHRIPRAKDLRVWRGRPTNCIIHSSPSGEPDTQNTVEKGPCNPSLEHSCLERDDIAQQLTRVPTHPHFLFLYEFDADRQPIPIERFPDHQHEGRVLKPETYDDCWPARPPVPEFVAFGSDKRFLPEVRDFPLVVAYDGDDADVGRIVADTSFHHFVNLNVVRLASKDAATGNPVPGTALDQIAQFYANLAYWLAPKDLRRRIKDEMRSALFFRAATNLDVYETTGNGAFHLGRVAKSVLELEVGLADIYRIVGATDNKSGDGLIDHLLDYALIGEGAPDGLGAGSQEFVLGSIIEVYHQFFREQGLHPLDLREDPTPPALAYIGLENVFLTQRSRAEGLLSHLTVALSSDQSNPTTNLRRRSIEMSQEETKRTDFVCGDEWESSVPSDGSVEFGIFDLEVDEHGNITGTFEGVDIISGTCTSNHMTITRSDGVHTFVYDGDITIISPNHFRAEGTRSRQPTSAAPDDEGSSQTPVQPLQEEWVAEKGGFRAATGTKGTRPE